MAKAAPKFKKIKLRSGKIARVYPQDQAPKSKGSFNRFMKAANILKRNPTLKGKHIKPAFMLVGQTEGGKEYYFNGAGFGSDDDVILTFPSERAAKRKAQSIKNRLPEKIRYLYVQPA